MYLQFKRLSLLHYLKGSCYVDAAFFQYSNHPTTVCIITHSVDYTLFTECVFIADKTVMKAFEPHVHCAVTNNSLK